MGPPKGSEIKQKGGLKSIEQMMENESPQGVGKDARGIPSREEVGGPEGQGGNKGGVVIKWKLT